MAPLHIISDDQGLEEVCEMESGDTLIRKVDTIHRGSVNSSDTDRPLFACRVLTGNCLRRGYKPTMLFNESQRADFTPAMSDKCHFLAHAPTPGQCLRS